MKTATTTESSIVADLRQIVAEGQKGKVSGQPLDLTSAHTLLFVLDNLKPENRSKLVAIASVDMVRAVGLAFRLAGAIGGAK